MKKYVICCDAYIEVKADNKDAALKKALYSSPSDWEFSNYNVEEDV